jgi:hypothetical protein
MCFTHKKNALAMLTGTLPHKEAFDQRWNNLTDATLFMMDASSINKASTHYFHEEREPNFSILCKKNKFHNQNIKMK